MVRPVSDWMTLWIPASLICWQVFAVLRSCQTIALWIGLPVFLSQRTMVSRWFVIPIAAMSLGVMLAVFIASNMVCIWLFQISFGSCSTSPGSGYICLNSFLLTAMVSPFLLNITERELEVPWSRDRMYCGMIDLIQSLRCRCVNSIECDGVVG